MDLSRTILVSGPILPIVALLEESTLGLVVAHDGDIASLGRRASVASRCYSIQDALQAVPPAWLTSRKPLSRQDLASLERRWFRAGAMLDRYNWGGESVAALDRRLNEYAEIWSGILDHVQANRVIFHPPPHRGWDFVAMALAEARGLELGIVDRTSIDSRLVLYPSIDAVPAVDWATNEDGSVLDSADGPESYYQTISLHTQKSGALKVAKRGLPDVPFRRRSSMAYLWRLRKPFQGSVEELPKGVPGRSHTPLGRTLKDLRIYWQIRRYLKRYNELAEDDIPEGPFILLALHFQPEATTLPMGGPYLDPLRVARQLLGSLPNGTFLAIKEHYQMFRWRRQWAQARDDDFLRRLIELKGRKLRIIAPDVNSQDLIEKCVAVATSTGTIGWEALQNGRPVLAFGRPWYSNCPGCYVMEADTDVRPAVELVEATDREALAKEVEGWRSSQFKRSSFVGPWRDEVERGEDEEAFLRASYRAGVCRYFGQVGGPRAVG